MVLRSVSLCLLLLGTFSAALGQEVSVSDGALTLDEGNSAQLCLDVVNANMIAGTATVTVMTEGSDDTRGGEDFVSLSEELSFTSSNQEMQCVTIEALQDDVVEAIEFFTVTLENPVGITVGSGQTLVTISQDDSDVIDVEFSSDTFTGSEGEGVAVCVVVLSGSVGRPLAVEVGLSASDVTTDALEDYSSVQTQTISVPDGTMTGDTACTSVGLTDDMIVEPDESFTLSLVAGQFEPLTVSTNTASVTIRDNDMAVVNVSSPLSVLEGNSSITNFNIEVELQIGSVPLARDVIVALSTEDGTATAGSDYEAVSADFTFVAGSSNGATMSMTVPIIGDEIGEPNEMFIISITSSTPDVTTSVTITILNDDRDCPDLPNPANGKVIETLGGITGSDATYSCNPGYSLEGGNVRRICENDAWTGSAPECLMDCPDLVKPSNGFVTVPSQSQGSTATYSCDEGYNVMGDSSRTCDSTATWTGSDPTCQIVDCGSPPLLENGQSDSPATTFGEVAVYMCKDGYNFTTMSDSPRQRVCLSSGIWSDANLECDQGIVDSGDKVVTPVFVPLLAALTLGLIAVVRGV